ncbi:ABC transporter permease [Actinosynnema sp. NPDC047251]|uniref:ABC-type transporter, permease subunit n=1 Tax=Saccharothrix espanaensis (strain ATCC 51144 / DSM 44229 / JCM 9112 / NBRC 15066 / NRRL 15764) TaxID=1179773 RepID=K0K820_SACES|nr:ABC transporter permease [Saccharothrix espanaensis]CCH32818.1 ABC-type transporter, permease subunit [Saccharothrix espanaensis DSM 44229]
MLRLVGARLLWSVPLLVSLSALTFLLAWLTPGDAARVVLGTNTDPAAYQQVRAQLGLDRPLWEQYGTWLGGAVRGDLGRSLFTGEAVSAVVEARLATTLSLLVLSAVVIAIVGVAVGLVGALRGGVVGRVLDGLSVVAMSVPTPWLGLVLVVVFAVNLAWFPVTGYVPAAQSPGAWLTALVLPVVCLAAGGIAVIAKQVRGAVVEVLGRPYVRSLRANGLPARRIVLRHVAKNAALPVVSVFGVVLIGLLGGSVVVEQLFALPGLGQLTVTAAAQHDLPILQGVVLCFTVLVVVVNLLVDLVIGRLDPRAVTR